MSRSIDERIVEMQFNSREFEQGVARTNAALADFSSNLDGLGDAGSGLSNLEKSVNIISDRFTALGIMGVEALRNIANEAINAGKNLVNNLIVQPRTEGFDEYEMKLNTVKTVMNSTGLAAEEVNERLKTLDDYADKTIYSTGDMLENLAIFTNQGIDLDKATTAMMGIANMTALAGQDAGAATVAYRNFSDAIGNGYMNLMDFRSLTRVSKIITPEVRKELLAAAEAAGTLEQGLDGLYRLAGTNSIIDVNFEDTLKEGWLTADVLLAVLNRYGDETTDVGNRAYEAATQISTMTAAMDTLKAGVATGWGQTAEIIIGTLPEAKAFWTGLTQAVGDYLSSMSDARNTMLQEWKDLGGRDDLIQGFKNLFAGITSLIKPIQDAFRDIFPKTTGADLQRISEGFKNFTENLKVSEGAMNAIKAIFTAFFSAIKLVIDGVKALAGGILQFTERVRPLASLILGLVGQFAQLVGAFFTTTQEAGTLQKVFDWYTTNAPIFRFFNLLIDKITELISNLPPLTEMLQIVGDRLETTFSVVTLDNLRKFTDTIVEFVQGMITKVKPVLGFLKQLGIEIGQFLGSFFEGFNWQGLMDGGIILGVIGLIRQFFNIVKDMTGSGSIFGKIKETLDGVRESFEAYQEKLKAKILQDIAIAIGVMVGSIVLLASVDPKRLMDSLGAMAIIFAELAGMFKILTMMTSFNDAAEAGIVILSLVGIALSLGIFASAVKKLAVLDWNQMSAGLIGASGIALIMIGLAKTMTSFSITQSEAMKRGALGLIGIAIAIGIVADAIVTLGSLDFISIIQGLGAMAVIVVAMHSVALSMIDANITPAQGGGLLLISLAIRVMAGAVKQLGEIDVPTLLTGLASLAAILIELGAFVAITESHGNMVNIGAGLILVATSMFLFAGAVALLGTMDIGILVQGLGAMATMLASLAVSTAAMPAQYMIQVGAGLVLMAAALIIVHKAVEEFGEMKWEDLVKGLIGVGGALAILVVAANSLNASGAGAGSMLVLAASVLVLAPALRLLGELSLGQVAVALIALAGSLTVLAIATSILAPLAGPMTVLAGAFALFGVGMLGLGVGVLALSVAFTTLAGAGVAVGAALTTVLSMILTMVPQMAEAIANGIVTFVKAIADRIPQLLESIGRVITAIFTLIQNKGPELINLVLNIITYLLDQIAQRAPMFAQAAVSIITDFLQAIASKAEDISGAGVDIILNFINGISSRLDDIANTAVDLIDNFIRAIFLQIPRLVEAGFQLIIDFINGMAYVVENQGEALIKAFFNLGAAIVKGIVKGLVGGIGDLIFGTKEMAEETAASLEDVMNQNRDFEESGMQIPAGVVQGIERGTPEVKKASEEMGRSSVGTLVSTIAPQSKIAGSAVGDGMIQGMQSSQSRVNQAATNMAQGAINAANRQLGIQSPSRVFEQIGNFLGEGLAIGITGMETVVNAASEHMGTSATQALKSAMTGIDQIIQSDMDLEPTITPVLDLSMVTSGAGQLGSMLGNGRGMTLDLSRARAAVPTDRTQTDSQTNQNGTTYEIHNVFEIGDLVVREEADVQRISMQLEKRQQQSIRSRGEGGVLVGRRF